MFELPLRKEIQGRKGRPVGAWGKHWRGLLKPPKRRVWKKKYHLQNTEKKKDFAKPRVF